MATSPTWFVARLVGLLSSAASLGAGLRQCLSFAASLDVGFRQCVSLVLAPSTIVLLHRCAPVLTPSTAVLPRRCALLLQGFLLVATGYVVTFVYNHMFATRLWDE